MPTNFHNIVNGELRSGTKFHNGIDPSNKQLLWDVAQATEQDLDDAICSARKAFTLWSKNSWDERAALILATRDALLADQAEMAILLTKEGGKPVGFLPVLTFRSPGANRLG
jgi:acyl-CoA reductase-like NAD-dependent aldehyde dehydrogenase